MECENYKGMGFMASILIGNCFNLLHAGYFLCFYCHPTLNFFLKKNSRKLSQCQPVWVSPDLGPNFLQSLLAEGKVAACKQRNNRKISLPYHNNQVSPK